MPLLSLHPWRRDDNLKSSETWMHASTVSASLVPGRQLEDCRAADRRDYPTSTTRTPTHGSRYGPRSNTTSQVHQLEIQSHSDACPCCLCTMIFDSGAGMTTRSLPGPKVVPNVDHSHGSQYCPGTGGATRPRKCTNLKSRVTRMHVTTASASLAQGRRPKHCWAADRKDYPTSTT
jgi:hypothetical protein